MGRRGQFCVEYLRVLCVGIDQWADGGSGRYMEMPCVEPDNAVATTAVVVVVAG